MMPPKENVRPAIAWVLESPSATSGKDYVVLIHRNFVVVGWGALTGTRQYQVLDKRTPEKAHQFALVKTETKELQGYKFAAGPYVSQPDQWDMHLGHMVGHRGSSTVLDALLGQVFLDARTAD